MKAPSFRCTVRPEDGALLLHYYSDRPGLEHIVIGIVKVFLEFFFFYFQIKKKKKNFPHLQMQRKIILICADGGRRTSQNRSRSGNNKIQRRIWSRAVPDNSAIGARIRRRHRVGRRRKSLFRWATRFLSAWKFPRQYYSNIISKFPDPKVSPATFCKVFPFHILFDRNMTIIQTGSTIARIMPIVLKNYCKITDILLPVGWFALVFFFFLFVSFFAREVPRI